MATLADCIGRLPALGVETALRLHKDALEESDHNLRSFVCGWASLEILAHKIFSANFDSAALSSLGLGENGWEGDLRKRLTKLDAKDLGIEDRLAFLAVWLSRSSGKADIEVLTRLNEARNDLYHRGIVPTRLPSSDVISLFRKYLSLQLARQR
jgi:hypothetical protein